MLLKLNMDIPEKELAQLHAYCKEHKTELAVMYGLYTNSLADTEIEPECIVRIGPKGFYLMQQKTNTDVWELGILQAHKIVFFEKYSSLEDALNSL